MTVINNLTASNFNNKTFEYKSKCTNQLNHLKKKLQKFRYEFNFELNFQYFKCPFNTYATLNTLMFTCVCVCISKCLCIIY